MLIDELRKEIDRRREQLSRLEDALDMLLSENGEPTQKPKRILTNSIRHRVVKFLESKGKMASVSTDELSMAVLQKPPDHSFQVNLVSMAKQGTIERLPMPNTWRMRT